MLLRSLHNGGGEGKGQQKPYPRAPSFEEFRDALDEHGCLPYSAWGAIDRFNALCPSHDDRNPSLSVSVGEDDLVVFNCKANQCSFEQILRDLDLWKEAPTNPPIDPRDIERGREEEGCSFPPRIAVSRVTRVSRVRKPKTREERRRDWERRAFFLGMWLDSGRDPVPGACFRCVLPGHEDQPGKIVVRHRAWRYWCEAIHLGLDRSDGVKFALSFAEVFKWMRMGEPHLPNLLGEGPLACRWFERLSYEAGVLEPTPVQVAIPMRASEPTIAVAESIALYLGLRDAGGGYALDQPFTFSRRFGMEYCDRELSKDEMRNAMRSLEQNGSITRVGTVQCHGSPHPAIEWRLASDNHHNGKVEVPR